MVTHEVMYKVIFVMVKCPIGCCFMMPLSRYQDRKRNGDTMPCPCCSKVSWPRNFLIDNPDDVIKGVSVEVPDVSEADERENAGEPPAEPKRRRALRKTAQCPICQKWLKNKAAVKSHLKRMHEGEDGGAPSNN